MIKPSSAYGKSVHDLMYEHDPADHIGMELLRLQRNTGAWWTRENAEWARENAPLRNSLLTEQERRYLKRLRPVPAKDPASSLLHFVTLVDAHGETARQPVQNEDGSRFDESEYGNYKLTPLPKSYMESGGGAEHVQDMMLMCDPALVHAQLVEGLGTDGPVVAGDMVNGVDKVGGSGRDVLLEKADERDVGASYASGAPGMAPSSTFAGEFPGSAHADEENLQAKEDTFMPKWQVTTTGLPIPLSAKQLAKGTETEKEFAELYDTDGSAAKKIDLFAGGKIRRKASSAPDPLAKLRVHMREHLTYTNQGGSNIMSLAFYPERAAGVLNPMDPMKESDY